MTIVPVVGIIEHKSSWNNYMYVAKVIIGNHCYIVPKAVLKLYFDILRTCIVSSLSYFHNKMSCIIFVQFFF